MINVPLIKDAKTTDFLVTKWYLWLPVVLVIVLNGRFGDITLPMERFWFGWYIIFGL